jgi:hypothetical protein
MMNQNRPVNVEVFKYLVSLISNYARYIQSKLNRELSCEKQYSKKNIPSKQISDEEGVLYLISVINLYVLNVKHLRKQILGIHEIWCWRNGEGN